MFGDNARSEHQWRHNTFTDFHIVWAWGRIAPFLSVFYTSTYPHVHVHVNVFFRFALTFYFTQFQVDNLRIPFKESVGLFDEFLLSTGCEPNADNFMETSVEPTRELLDSPPVLSDKVSDAALAGMRREAHRVHSHHCPREDLFVILLWSSVSDKTGRPVGDRTGRPVQ